MAAEPFHTRHQEPAPLAGTRLDALLREFGVCAIAKAVSSFGSVSRALLFVATARACGPFDTGTTARAPRPVSVNALAASLGRPFETTRRNVNLLIQAELIHRSDAGLSVPLAAVANPAAAGFSDHCHDLMVRLVEDIRAGNMLLPPGRDTIGYDPRAGTGIAFDLLLAGFECHSQRDSNLTRLTLMAAIGWANNCFGVDLGATIDPAPVKASMVARILGLPYATVSRNIDLLVTENRLVRVTDGLILQPDHDMAPPVTDARLKLSNRARQLIGRLAQAGFPMHRPTLGYIRQRPPLPALG